MSNTIATIPNYCSYQTFKTGFADGIGAYCRTLDWTYLQTGGRSRGSGHSRSCQSTRTHRVIGIKSEQAVDKDAHSAGKTVGDQNNNSKSMPRRPTGQQAWDWFDAYSVQFDSHSGKRKSIVVYDNVNNDLNTDYHQEIENILAEGLNSECRSSGSVWTDKRSSAKSWKSQIDKESFRYSTETGCIDWLDSCSVDFNSNSDSDLIKSFDRSRSNRSDLGYFGGGMYPLCSHLKRKLGTDNSSCEDERILNLGENGETTLEEEVFEEELYYLGPPTKPNGNGYLDGQGLVTIRMIPDEQGRFGFNVKGGADQGMPIIVSRVAPNTPADNAIPRLNEGDQVLFINGRDVSQHTHEQVVLFIRHSRETRSKELVLIVRPNAYSGDENSDEPDFVYDAETHQISSASTGGNALDLSLKLLEESLESGAALAQFEQLYRKKPGMTMNSARLEENIPKNRYRDISPYDQTRVILKNGATGDYINANYVNMEIPVSGIVNRYIAAQGPLPTTCIDFWQMVWEQQSTLVVMLTTKVERGRIKCHQYWPDLYETSDHGHLQITCVKEEETASFAFREFNLTHVESQEERHISHMQYIAWPDHGVPDDPADFLEFVIKVRQKRVGLVEPSIVHCSAGIGRTGVLITMETAMCLTEANQPVYPLSIVRQMRDQRAMLIQTPNQYKFVCEAIIRCFNEGIVKPLPEYQQR